MFRGAICQPPDRLEEDVYLSVKRTLLTGIQLQFLAKSTLEQLAARLDETICLAVPSSGDQMLIVDMVPSSRHDDFPSLIGLRYPLAPRFQNRNCAEVINCESQLPNNSFGASKRFDASLLKTPLWNGRQKVCGWLCLLGKTARLPPKRIRELLPVLRDEGEALSVLLGKINLNEGVTYAHKKQSTLSNI